MRILRENTVGLIIDFQERLLPHMQERRQLLENTQMLIKGLKALDIPLLVTEQYRKGLGATVPEISDLFDPFHPLEKVAFSCCDDQGCVEALAATGRKYVLISGIEAHVCVMQTAVDLREKGCVPVLIADCVSSRKPDDRQTALSRMRQEGVIVASCESILFELCRYAGTDRFRAISKLVK